MDVERISIIENFVPKNDDALLKKAKAYQPQLLETTVRPIAAYRMAEGNKDCGMPIALNTLSKQAFGAGDSVCLDFGSHWVGYCTLKVGFVGSHPDAPAYLKLQFAEVAGELDEDAETYRGWISKSWIQEERLHLDRVPSELRLPRRYAFRYLKITVLDTSKKYRVTLDNIVCRAASAVDLSSVSPLRCGDPLLDRIDAISLKTLADCMQEVFEDGPKRDRRLWLGDFRLQALINYRSFRHRDLVRRCLYLFAGTRFPDDRIAACIFTDNEATADDTWFSDYALFYPIALEEYLREYEDAEVLHDLYELAVLQIDRALASCENGVVSQAFSDAAFIDWCPGLDKAACAEGVLLYALPYAIVLANRMHDAKRAERYAAELALHRAAAKRQYWNEVQRCFVSNEQVSPAAQIWMVLGGVLETDEAAELLSRIPQAPTDYPMVSPYMHHYYLEALLATGMQDAALAHLKAYWGSMVERDADTFWEIWNPDAPDASPYGGTIVNSWCHAWSCSPAYLLRSGAFSD